MRLDLALFISVALSVILSVMSVASAEGTSQGESRLPEEVSQPRPPYRLERVIKEVATRHPLARARGFEIQAEQRAYHVSETALDPSLSLEAQGNHNLSTISDPTQQGALRGLTTKRYTTELALRKPLQWGTQLSLAFSESLIDTDNPFNNCVPGLPSDKCYETRLSLSLTQPLLRGRSTEANLSTIRVARGALRLAKINTEREVTRLVFETSSAYAQLLLAEAQLALERREEALATRQLEDNSARVQAGVVAQSELAALRLTLAQRTQARLEATRRCVEAQEDLFTLSGERPEGALVLPDWVSDGPPNGSLEGGLNLTEHLEVRAMDERLAQLDAQLTQLRDQALPQLNAGLVLSQSGLGEGLNESLRALPENRSRFYGATISFQYPISQRGELQLQALLARQRSLREERRATLRRLEGSRASLIRARPALEAILAQARQALIASRETVSAVEGRLEAGRATRFEVSQRQEAARASELAVLQAQHALLNHHLSALRLKGALLSTFGVELRSVESVETD